MFVVLAVGLVALLWYLAPSGPPGAPKTESVEDTLIRERAAAFFRDDQLSTARAELAPLVGRDDAALTDLVHAAAVEFNAGEYEAAAGFLDRAEKIDPRSAEAAYLRSRMALADGEFERALAALRIANESASEDLPTRLELARVLYELGETDQAVALYRSVLEVGVEHGGSWYITAVYRMLRIAVETGQSDEAQRYQDIWEEYKQRGYKAASLRELDKGNLGTVRVPQPQGTQVAAPRCAPRFEGEPVILPELAGATELFLHDLDGDRDFDLVVAGPGGLWIATQSETGFEASQVDAAPTTLVRALDLGNDDDLDFLAVQGDRLLIFERTDAGRAGWDGSRVRLPELGAPAADVTPVDFDHDGDLDLLCVGAFGARLLRNDGAATPEGAFVDATDVAGFPAGSFTWCLSEDLDSDNDVDLLFGGAERVVLAYSLRGGRFEDRAAAALGAGVRFRVEPLVADLDGDARPDLFAAGDGQLWRQRPDGTFAEESLAFDSAEHVPLGVDVDLDGALDALWSEAGTIRGALAAGLAVETACTFVEADPVGPFACADIDRDLDVDLVVAGPDGVEILRGVGPVGGSVRLEFVGLKDNRRGVGAVVEVRTGPIYRRIFWRGDPLLCGAGEREWIDVLRITWPNGIDQTLLDVDLGDQTFLDENFDALQQPEGQIGSCPFLYSWNGSSYEFVSDVLGATPLGLPMAPGRLVAPDHDEYVLVRGEQLSARDGFFELQFTEELREVTYLDRARLDVVDHPAGTEVYPNERFTFPPFPEHRIHALADVHAPVSATGSDGRDWTRELAAIDDVHARPFEPLAPQFLGLATPHWLELEFDPALLRDASELRLVFTGWFYWTDASVNMASARTPGVDFVPPILSVPGPDGSWQPIGPPVGFPAGKTKTMVIDVSEHLRHDDPRIRVGSTLRLYWDSIRLALDQGDAEVRVTSIEPSSADLWRRGFSMPVPPARADQPERFEWERTAERARWNQHPGQYTRYGDTLELVTEVDDRFVIMGAGDALTVRFDARALAPPARGWTRDYLLYLDGWAKDRDPNTVEALEVEPLPFHGMSGYPYGPDEHFPDGPLHQEWRREWNTRPAHEWIVPLAPRLEQEWLLGLE